MAARTPPELPATRTSQLRELFDRSLSIFGHLKLL